jgi:diguanylate cyclase (GGDEF)-like protein
MWCRLRATGIYDDSTGALLKIVGVIIDIEDEMKATMALQERAEHDSLTGLLNAKTTRKRAEEYLAECQAEEKCALLVVDLDHFKHINDRFGHMHGDAVLMQVAEVLRSRFRSQDIVGRIGGEEFIILIKGVSDSDLIHKRCRQLLESMHEIYKGSMDGIVVSCSIGAVMAMANGVKYSQLFDRADQAMYQAKEQGRDQYVFCEIDKK